MRGTALFPRFRLRLAVVAAAAAVHAAAGAAVRAQERGAVRGTVLSTIASERGEPVPGVAVRIPEVRLATDSDDAGRFELRAVPPGLHEVRAELLGCLLGSRRVEVRAGETTEADFTVSRPAIELRELVATGVAAEPRGVAVAYSVGEVSAEETRGRRARSLADLIRGEFPGVRIFERGQAGGEISIQLRGPTSISGSQHPLVVIDGIITQGGFIDLNPNDVANVSVLKGAAAAAEYGARGGAGVIEVTTIAGARPRAARSGPVVVVDGEISAGGLSGIDSESILHLETMTGARAGVLFGASAEARGVLQVTTWEGAEEGGENVLSRCVPPPR